MLLKPWISLAGKNATATAAIENSPIASSRSLAVAAPLTVDAAGCVQLIFRIEFVPAFRAPAEAAAEASSAAAPFPARVCLPPDSSYTFLPAPCH